MVYRLLFTIMLLSLSGCASSDGQADKETHVIPQMTTGAVTITVPLPAAQQESVGTPMQPVTYVFNSPLATISQTMTLSDSALKGGNQDGTGGEAKQETKPVTDITIPVKAPGADAKLPELPVKEPEVPTKPSTPPVVVVPKPGEPDPEKPPVPNPQPEIVWEILETYDDLRYPPEVDIDDGRSFSWLKRGKGSNYPTTVRLRWPACNYSCIVDDTAHDQNYMPSKDRDANKCSWYSAMDGTDKHSEGSFFSRGAPKCETRVGYIETLKGD